MPKILETFVIFLLVHLAWALCFDYVLSLYLGANHTTFDGVSFTSRKDQIYLSYIFAPIFETLIFQLFPIWTILNIFENKTLAIVVSSLLFASVHTYNIFYFVATIGAGIILALYFVQTLSRYNYWIAYFLTILLHSAYNFSVDIFNRLF